ncbi:MAG: T9SS type A sorting domain-containing protein [Flavobacteriales bacterium]|nr:T9SS type A sorting domain-containing protein [Flavobacteriales bacterium]
MKKLILYISFSQVKSKFCLFLLLLFLAHSSFSQLLKSNMYFGNCIGIKVTSESPQPVIKANRYSTTVPVAGANSSTYGSSFSGSTIAINGNFTINNTFAVNNKTLLMAPNTKIIVLPGARLIINKSKLYSCGTDMWDGIEIQPGGELILNRSLIEDAKVGVLSDNLGGISKFTISNSLFNRNYTGVKVVNYSSTNPHPSSISNTTFDSRPSITSTSNSRLLDAPYQTQTAEIGVELYAVNSILIGNTGNPALKNKFKYLYKGIYSFNSNYTCYNNEFSDNAPKGWAIYNHKKNKAVIGGIGTNQANVFKNLYNGISHTSSYDLWVENNVFFNINLPNTFFGSNAVAVYTNECNNATITLQKNSLLNIANGFVHFTNADAKFLAKENSFNLFTGKAISATENRMGTVDVLINSMTNNQSILYSGNTAVYVAGTGNTFTTSTVLKIENNSIARANKGIHIINIGNPQVMNNSISFAANIFPTLSEFYFGIRTQNCQREEIHLNTIEKIGSAPLAGYENALYGISVENSASNPSLTENTVKKTGSAFRFRGFYTGAGYRCNTMTNNWFGLVIDNANIGNQGEAPSVANPNGLASDNSWTNPSLIGSSTAVKGYGTSFSPAFYTRVPGGYPFTPENPHISPFPLTPYTILTASNTPLTINFLNQADELCQTVCYDPATCKIPKLAKIARNENPFDQIQGNQRFLMHEQVLKAVWADSLVPDVNTTDGQDLQAFLDTIALSNVGLTAEVHRLMSAKDTLAAEQLNASINPKECADAFHKTVNEIYFRTWAKSVFEFSPSDSTTLTNIALQDPLACGSAIYSARVMLGVDVNDYSVDNTNGYRLMNTAKMEAAATPSTAKGKWYPNPAKDEVNYEIQLSDEQSGQIVIIDLMGKEHASAPLNSGSNKLSFDVKMLPNGIYFYRVMVNSKLHEVNKFIIQH